MVVLNNEKKTRKKSFPSARVRVWLLNHIALPSYLAAVGAGMMVVVVVVAAAAAAAVVLVLRQKRPSS